MKIKKGIFPALRIKKDLKTFYHGGSHDVKDAVPKGIRCEVLSDEDASKPYGNVDYDRIVTIQFTVHGVTRNYSMRSWEIEYED